MQIGGYEVIEEIARGGGGIVYRARDPARGREVAVKVLRNAQDASATQLKRFQREVSSLSKLLHPQIVTVLGSGDHEGSPFFVMEDVPGESLQALLDAQGGALRPREAAEMTLKLVRAVEHAHGHGVLHRDLKPSNVLVSPNGQVMLTDFGLAKDLDASLEGTALSVRGRFMGTPCYLAPEQAAGDPDGMGPHTDVYGLGAVFYALLTGDPPIVADSLVEILVATKERSPTPPSRLKPGVDGTLESICLCCLEKEPSDRYPSAAALGDALEAYLAGEPVVVPGTQRRLDWRLPIFGAALVSLAVGIGATVVVQRGAAAEARRQEAELLLAGVEGVAPSSPDELRGLRAKVAQARRLSEGLPAPMRRVTLAEERLVAWEGLLSYRLDERGLGVLEAGATLLELRRLAGSSKGMAAEVDAASERWLGRAGVAGGDEAEGALLELAELLTQHAKPGSSLGSALIRMKVHRRLADLKKQWRGGITYSDGSRSLEELEEMAAGDQGLLNEVRFEVAYLQLRRGRYTEAETRLRVLQDVEGPLRLRACQLSAWVIIVAGTAETLARGAFTLSTPEELAALKRVVQLDPDGVIGTVARALREPLGSPRRTELSLQASAMEPDNFFALLLRAQQILVLEGRVEESFEMYERARLQHPDDATVPLFLLTSTTFYASPLRPQMGYGPPMQERWLGVVRERQTLAMRRYMEITAGSNDPVRRIMARGAARAPR